MVLTQVSTRASPWLKRFRQLTWYAPVIVLPILSLVPEIMSLISKNNVALFLFCDKVTLASFGADSSQKTNYLESPLVTGCSVINSNFTNSYKPTPKSNDFNIANFSFVVNINVRKDFSHPNELVYYSVTTEFNLTHIWSMIAYHCAVIFFNQKCETIIYHSSILKFLHYFEIAKALLLWLSFINLLKQQL